MLTRLRASLWVRGAVLLLVLGFAGAALYASWQDVGRALQALPLWVVPVSLLAAMTGMVFQLFAWRMLLGDLGSRVPPVVAARVMFLAQLAKYLPGSMWALAAQVELAKEWGVPRTRGAAATLLAMAVTLSVNLAVALALLPFTSTEAARRWWWALAAAPVLLALLHPRVVTAVLHAVARVVARVAAVTGQLDRVSGRGMAGAAGLSAMGWLPLGLHIWLLVVGVGGASTPAADPRTIALAAGVYALAWTVGVLAVLAPAGIGVREAVIVVGLSPVLDPGAALVVAALSRLVMTSADLSWGGLVLLFTRRAPHTPPRSTSEEAPGQGGAKE